VDLRSGHAHMNLHRDAAPALLRVAQHRNMTVADSIMGTPQPFSQLARPGVEGTGTFDAAKRKSQRERHGDIQEPRLLDLTRQTEMQLDQVGHRPGAHLLHHLGAVDLHGALTEIQVDGDHLVGGAVDDHVHDLALPRGQ